MAKEVRLPQLGQTMEEGTIVNCLVKVDDEVTITTGLRRRSFKVPRRIAPLPLASAKLEGSCLVVSFTRDAAGAEAD